MKEIKVGDVIKGKVKMCKPYGLFLTFENGNEGLLHISEISDGFVKDIEKYGTIDDEINVLVLDIDPKTHFLKVSYKKVPEENFFSTHDNNGKRKISIDESDFDSLKNMIPIWIKEAYKRAKGDKND